MWCLAAAGALAAAQNFDVEKAFGAPFGGERRERGLQSGYWAAVRRCSCSWMAGQATFDGVHLGEANKQLGKAGVQVYGLTVHDK